MPVPAADGVLLPRPHKLKRLDHRAQVVAVRRAGRLRRVCRVHNESLPVDVEDPHAVDLAVVADAASARISPEVGYLDALAQKADRGRIRTGCSRTGRCCATPRGSGPRSHSPGAAARSVMTSHGSPWAIRAVPKEPASRCDIPALGHVHVDHLPVLVHGPVNVSAKPR